MKKITIYDKPMCSAKVSCGQANSKEITKVLSLKKELEENNIEMDILYANFHMAEFLKHEEINGLLAEGGYEILPITIADGKIIKKGQYPTSTEVRDSFSRDFVKIPLEFMRKSCGCGGNCDGSCK